VENRWSEGVWATLAEVADRLAGIVPGLLAMVVLVIVGLLTGWLARAVTSRVARLVGFDRHMERWGVGPSLRRSGIFRDPADLLGAIAFWAMFVIFASLGVDSLGVPGSTGAAAFLVSFLPPLFAAVLVLLVGLLVANFLSQGLLIAAVNAGLPEARLLARAVQWGVLLFAGATALTHLGIGKEMVLVGFGITFGGLVFALALAFGLGGRSIAREMLERRLRRESPPREERLTHL
jgi:mechanosensitive ion channel-like protein